MCNSQCWRQTGARPGPFTGYAKQLMAWLIAIKRLANNSQVSLQTGKIKTSWPQLTINYKQLMRLLRVSES